MRRKKRAVIEKELTFEYGFNFFNNEYDDNINQDDKFRNLITAAVEQLMRKKQLKAIDKKQKQKLFIIRGCLYGIAKENNAKITIKNSSLTSTICVEVESDVLYFDNEKLKSCLIEAVITSKFFSIESNGNGKFTIIAEIDTSEDIDTKAE